MTSHLASYCDGRHHRRKRVALFVRDVSLGRALEIWTKSGGVANDLTHVSWCNGRGVGLDFKSFLIPLYDEVSSGT